MRDIGEMLRQARERRGLSLRQLADNTKIAVATLEALERNDFSRLPGGIFSRGFVRSYALEVGLDPDRTLQAFLAAMSDAVAAPEKPPAVPEHESEFESQQRIATIVLKLVVISVALILTILYLVLRRG